MSFKCSYETEKQKKNQKKYLIGENCSKLFVLLLIVYCLIVHRLLVYCVLVNIGANICFTLLKKRKM